MTLALTRPAPAVASGDEGLLTDGPDGPDGDEGRRRGRRRPLEGRAARRATTARLLLRRPGFLVALAFVVLVVVSALAPGLFTSADPYATAPIDKLLPPGPGHPFGTDELGRDLFSRVLHGGLLTVQAVGLALVLALVVGLTLGVVAGFVGGWVDAVVMRAVDVLLAIPGLLLALAIVTAIGYGTVPVAVAVGIGIVPGFARTTRAEVLRVRTLPYVEAARTGGASWGRVLLRHVLPNSWGPVAVLAVLDLGAAVIAVAALSFLGFGAAPPAAEWGTLISTGRSYLVTSPWLSLLPGVFVGLLVLGLNHVARTLEEVQR
ncbi:ABC transporter permease [Cellulomonas marina]|uniref:Peptide/nickel transport system permease protein n=1 Tax=Cellulomonas marina TaxID=988821 RepID=A0A1I0ZFU5_9CELL|nr:ABC transporter permease [Cellulomonas marina]GIG28528.1 ABC transporter permease [Cellulomonas marina]SFB24391.1 peptide/nickel transport system permease protein [Cellulomonas marina]